MIIIKKYGFIAVLIAALMLFEQNEPAVYAADENSEGDFLVIRHIAKSPDGAKRVLGIEKIENLTDVYYYRAATSPVASKFLNNGYSLSNEKNSIIEADVVSNGGKIDLEYTPSVQSVNVTYFKNENGTETEMGTLTGSAYVGDEYKPLPPVYESADVLTELLGDEKHIVKYGENNFRVSYSVKDESGARSEGPAESESAAIIEGEGAVLSNIRLKDTAYITGYPDRTFRPENNIAKTELFTILYCLLGGKESGGGNTLTGAVIFLKNNEIIKDGETGFDGFVTWSDFYTYLERLNDALPGSEKIAALKKGERSSFYNEGGYVKRAEAVAVINEILLPAGGRDAVRALNNTDNPFIDVNKNYWAYNEIISAAH